MHPTVLEFTERVVREHDLNQHNYSVLVVGALDVNGSVRPYFDKAVTYGIDITDGEGVDLVMDAHDIPWQWEGAYDVVACTEMLEHDDEFWKSLEKMGMVLRPGGYLLLTARGARPGVEGKRHGESMWEHAYPDDYYRFMPNAVPKLLSLANCETIENVQDTYYPGFLALGKKV